MIQASTLIRSEVSAATHMLVDSLFYPACGTDYPAANRRKYTSFKLINSTAMSCFSSNKP